MIYIIEHPDRTFTGFLGGVDYHKGRGSTSNIQDARAAQEIGCIIRDQEGKRLFVQRTFDEGRSEHFEAHESPVEDGQRPEESRPQYVNRADRRQRERTERRLR